MAEAPTPSASRSTSWLAWAAALFMAVLFASAAEFWIVERARNRLLEQESLLAGAAVQAAQNQLEAERILARASPEGTPGRTRVLLLAAPDPAASRAGFLTFDLVAARASLSVSGQLPDLPKGSYELWAVGGDPARAISCGRFSASQLREAGSVPVRYAPPKPGVRYLLVAASEGAQEAPAAGSIVLASSPPSQRISGR